MRVVEMEVMSSGHIQVRRPDAPAFSMDDLEVQGKGEMMTPKCLAGANG